MASFQDNLTPQTVSPKEPWARDLSAVLLVTAICMGISAHSPSDTYAFAQLRQIGATIGSLNSGNWVLPRTQEDRVARKGPMYAWILAPVLAATGIYDEIIFRIPTILGTFVTAGLVYILGRRWFGRREGLIAGCLWGCMLHMGKLAFIATTDMLLTAWFTASIFCLDRVLFHRAPRKKRFRWVVGFWLTILGGVLTKGWGLANIVPIGLTVLLATGIGHGFSVLRRERSIGGKVGLLVRILGRRWWRAIHATHAIGGIVLVLAILVVLFVVMADVGGRDFRDTLYREVWQRFTGEGGVLAPPSSSLPPVVTLIYFTLPASVFALGGLLLLKPRRWLRGSSPVSLPIFWILGLVIPYSFSHGFRPDYLLPCYAAVALMAAWATEQMCRRGREGGKVAEILRHAFAATPLLIALAVIVIGAIFLFHIPMPKSLGKAFGETDAVRVESWWILGAAVAIAIGILVLTVWSSLQWKIRNLAFASVAAMLCLLFVDGHFLSRHAKTADGDHMVDFGRQVRKIIGGDEFAVYRMEKLCTEIYIGRFGKRILYPASIPPGIAIGAGNLDANTPRPLDALNQFAGRWLLTCDRGLLELGACAPDPNGDVILEIEKPRSKTRAKAEDGEKRFYRVFPAQLGRVCVSGEPIRSQRWGRMYLIELSPPPRRVSGEAVSTGFVSGTAEE